MDIFDAKALKLSEPMVKMISGAEIHEVRVNGEIVRRGYMIAGRSGTIVALMDRGICTASSAEFHGMNWLTELGLVALTSLTGAEVPSMDDMPVYLNTTSEDHPTQSDMITDAERAEIIAGTLKVDQAAFLLGGWDVVTRTHGIEEELRDLGLWIVSVGTTVMGTLVWDVLATNPRFAAIADQVAAIKGSKSDDAQWHDVAAGEAHYESLNPEYRGDDEKTFDMENAALEGADIRAEYEAEVAEESNTVADYMNAELDTAMNVVRALSHADLVDALIAEIMADDRLMYLTPKGIFVSGEYVNTMRRLSEDSTDSILAWRSRQYQSRLTMADDFHVLDMMVDEGTMSYGKADRFKRIIRATCRPHIGPKRKPSLRRRNRR